MISPAQTTTDLSGLPQAVQNLSAAIDATLGSWTLGEESKELTFTWASLGGWTAGKELALRALLRAYARVGWRVEQISRSQTAYRAAFFRNDTDF